ncbi:MAG TPA: SprT family zinc-dependent metalloprotease [Allosphingosinicella sp.]|nr:SprT family zinc-dependent metalloprotease [Allosphingosinicella sp.]
MSWSFTSSTASSELRIGETPVQLRISPRARKLRLSVDPRTRAVLLTVPRRVSQRRALAWAGEHRQWIEQQLAHIPPPRSLAPGESVPVYGEAYVIDWEASRPRKLRLEQGRLICGGPLEGLDRRILRWLKSEALDLLTRETREFAERTGARLERVGIGDPVSRWGSCSSRGTIRYSWRLIMAPDFVRRATVAHEVAHLVHLNHGPDFHALVAAIFGADPKPARLWLKREGAALHRIGPR